MLVKKSAASQGNRAAVTATSAEQLTRKLRDAIEKVHERRIQTRNWMRRTWIFLFLFSFLSVLTDAIKSVYHPTNEFYYFMVALVLLTCAVGLVMPRWLNVFDRPQNLLVALKKIDHDAMRFADAVGSAERGPLVAYYVHRNNVMLRRLAYDLKNNVSLNQDLPVPR